MTERYTVLPIQPLAAGTAVMRRSGDQGRVTMDDPATRVMTDLRRVPARTTSPDLRADDALASMIHAGVRLLLVVDEHDAVQGVVTARDILGEKPVQAAKDEGIAREAVRVMHVMTPVSQIEILNLDTVEKARVGDVLQTLKDKGRQHILVVMGGGDGEAIGGIFSATQIGRQLGVEVPAEGPAQSFAEIERLLQA